MLSLLVSAALSAAFAGTSIQGRVLERALMKPVPGAKVALLGRPGLSAITDSNGVFKIVSSATGLREDARSAGPKAATADLGMREREGFLWRDAESGRDAAGRMPFGGAGSTGGANPGLASDEAQDFGATVGRQSENGSVGSGKTARGLLGAAARTAVTGALPSAAPGPAEVSCAGLVTKQVAAASDTANLGDIVLDYPPRQFDLGVKPIYGSIMLFDGTRVLMDSMWQMWMGTYRIQNKLPAEPLTWQYLPDPVDSGGMTMRTCCDIQWGNADVVTKRKFKDFQLHVEWNPVSAPRVGGGNPGPANSGVYLQSFYEIQIKDDYGVDSLGAHDCAGILNETAAPINLCRPRGQWQSYDITFRAARWSNGVRTEKARLTLYWNGKLVHKDKETANEHAFGVSSDTLVDAPKGLKLQSEGHDVRFRNVWIKELNLVDPNSDIGY